MLNRRHLRIKGFQALYAYQQAEVKEQKMAEKQLLQAVQLVHDAYINLLQLALEIAQFEENAVAEKSHKHMPTAADLNSTAVLLKNKFKSNNSVNTLTYKSSNFLMGKWKRNVIINPIEYLKKCSFNVIRIFANPFYPGSLEKHFSRLSFMTT